VFQVCTLIEQKSAFTAARKLGVDAPVRGSAGNRIEDRDVNILHVMANESFAEFADTLQRRLSKKTA
jgi:type III restriction enzyme